MVAEKALESKNVDTTFTQFYPFSYILPDLISTFYILSLFLLAPQSSALRRGAYMSGPSSGACLGHHLGHVWSMLIPHICHFLYTGRIFKFQILHLKMPKIYPQRSQICSFLASKLEQFTPDKKIYTGSARGARDKYEVWDTTHHACTKT